MSKKENAQKFFNEYKELCKKYNLSLAHEDYHGGFILEEYKEDNIEWAEASMMWLEEE